MGSKLFMFYFPILEFLVTLSELFFLIKSSIVMVSALNILLVQVQTWRSLLLVARPNPLHVYMFGSSLIFLRNRNLMLPSYPSPWLWSCIKPFYQLAPKAITARCKPQAAEVKRGMPMSIVRLQRLRQPEHFYLPPRTSQTECWTDFVQERRPLLHPSFNDFTRCSSAKENPLPRAKKTT